MRRQEAISWHLIGAISAEKGHSCSCFGSLLLVSVSHTLSLKKDTKTQNQIRFNHAHTLWFAIQPTALWMMYSVQCNQTPLPKFIMTIVKVYI